MINVALFPLLFLVLFNILLNILTLWTVFPSPKCFGWK